MVRLSGRDLRRSKQLLEQNDAGELMGKRLRAERDPLPGSGQRPVRQPLWPADQKPQISRLETSLLEPAAPGFRVHRPPEAVDRHEVALGRQPTLELAT